MKKYPLPPYPSVGEIVFECAVRSGLVRSNETDSHLYEDLKAFKDDRLRPGLRPIEFPKYVLVDLEDRLASFIGEGSIAAGLFAGIRKWLDWYAGITARHDATLLEREVLAEQILWPTAFSFGGTVLLSTISKLFPTANPIAMLDADAPLGEYLNFLFARGKEDIKTVCDYRSQKHNIDTENCRDTVEEWLSGEAVPSLAKLKEILDALELGTNTSFLIWLPVARLLAKTSKAHRACISVRMKPDHGLPDPETHLSLLRKQISWDIGKTLNIGPDRPFAKLRAALYDPSIPRNAADVEDMLARLERTWEPIANQTMHTVEWLRGRYLVLSDRLDEAYEHYLAAYNLGAGRDPDIYREVLDEALALAAALGKKRAVERFEGLLGLYWTTEWDGDYSTLEKHFWRKFPSELFFCRSSVTFLPWAGKSEAWTSTAEASKWPFRDV